jgi:hypothetical protein
VELKTLSRASKHGSRRCLVVATTLSGKSSGAKSTYALLFCELVALGVMFGFEMFLSQGTLPKRRTCGFELESINVLYCLLEQSEREKRPTWAAPGRNRELPIVVLYASSLFSHSCLALSQAPEICVSICALTVKDERGSIDIEAYCLGKLSGESEVVIIPIASSCRGKLEIECPLRGTAKR